MYTDQELLELLCRDPEEGMTQVIDQFTAAVWAAASQYLPAEEDVRECVNDVFAEFYFKQKDFDPQKGTLKGWLARMAQRRAIDRWRTGRGHAADPLDEAAAAQPEGLSADEKIDLEAALAQLSDQDAQLLRMKYFEGLNAKEIAARLDLPYETVKKRQQRSLKKLRKALLVGLVLALLALLAACGYAVLRYFGILPGYGVNTDPESTVYILEQPASAESGEASVTIQDAVLADGRIALTLLVQDGPASETPTESSNEYANGHWYETAELDNGRITWQGGQAAASSGVSTAPGEGLDGKLRPDGLTESKLFFTVEGEAPTGESCPMTLDLGWLRLDFVMQAAEQAPLERYSYALAEAGGVLAIPSLQEGRLVVDLYPLNSGDFTVEPHLVRCRYSNSADARAVITAEAADGTVLLGTDSRFNPYSSDTYSRWDFGPAQPGAYTLHIPFLYLSADLPQDITIPLPQGGGPWQVPGGALSAAVTDRQPQDVQAGSELGADTIAYYVSFALQSDRQDMTLAGLHLSAAVQDAADQAGSRGNISYLYHNDWADWWGLRAEFPPLANENGPCLAPASADAPLSQSERARITYRWDHSLEIEIHIAGDAQAGEQAR